MKKIIFITFAMLAILTTSCTDESAKQSPMTQSSSIWRSTIFTDTTMSTSFEYYELRFISDSSIELWVKRTANESPEKVNLAYTYTIKDNSISIVYNDVTSKGTIDKSVINIAENGSILKFVKI